VTCIVGIEQDGAVYIGGDSAGIEEDSLAICRRADEKVFVNDTGEFIMGFCGSFRVGQLLRYALEPPEQSLKKDDMAYLVTDFVDAVRAVQRDKGSLSKENELEELDAAFLVGYKGRLYTVESDFQVGRPVESYAAVGCGAQIALGALYALQDTGLDPKSKIEVALSAAAEYSAGVRGPFLVLQLPAEQEAATV